MSGLSILNPNFEVVEYNGGAGYGKIGVANILAGTGVDCHHITRHGKNFDLVLEYKGAEEFFTLNYLVFQPSGANARDNLRNVAVWLHSEKPDVSAYSSRFDDMLPTTYKEKNASERPTPAPVEFFTIHKRQATPVHINPVSGRFIHIKFLDSYAAQDSVISIGPLCIVGSEGKNAAQAVNVVAPYTAPATSTAAPVAAGSLGGMDWATMFSAGAGKKQSLPVISFPEEEKKALIDLDVLPPIFRSEGANKVHPAFEDKINESPCIFMVSSIPIDAAVDAAKNGTATEEQEEVAKAYAALNLAATYEGHAELNYFYLDNTVDKETLSVCLSYLCLPSAQLEIDNSIVLPESAAKPYSIIAASNVASAHLSDQRENYVSEAIVIIGNQGRVGLNSKGLGRRTAKVKVDFAKAVATGIKEREESLTSALASLSLNGGNSAEITAFAREIYTLGQLFVFHEQTDCTELELYQAKETAPEGNCLPRYPDVKVATASTFADLVLDHDRPVFTVFNGNEVGNRLTPYAVELARLCKKHNIDADVVLFNPSLNTVADVVEPGDKDGAIRLFVKSVSPPDETGITQLDTTLTNLDDLIVSIYDMPIFVPRIMEQLKKELDGEAVGVDDADLEDEDEDEESEQSANIVMPALEVLLKFIRRYAPDAFPSSLDESQLIMDLDSAQKALLCRVVVDQIASTVDRHLSANGLGVDLNYRYAVDSAEGQALALLKSAPAKIKAILSRVAIPMGTWTDPTAEVPAPTPFAEYVPELANLLVEIDAALKLSAHAAFQFISARESYVVAANTIKRFSDVLQAEGVLAEFQTAYENLRAIFGDLPTIVTSVDAHKFEKTLTTPTDQYVNVHVTSLHATGQHLNDLYNNIAAKLFEEANKRDKASGFSAHCVTLNSYSELERIISGYKNAKKPPAKKMIGRKSSGVNDPMVENAEERVIAIYATQTLCDHEALRDTIVKAHERSQAEAAANGFEDPNIVFVQVNLKHYADAARFIEMFNIKELPALRFIHSMSVIDEMNVDGGAVDTVEAVIDTIESLFAEDEQMVGEDEGFLDEDFTFGGFEEDM